MNNEVFGNIIIGTKKLAKILGCSAMTIYRYCDNGMPYTKISESKRAYNLDQIKEWLSSNKK